VADFPTSLPEFERRFPDEAACAEWLLEHRWGGGFACPGCGHDRFWRLAQAFSALYPASTDEKRWVDGVLARKKSLGF